MKYLVLSVMFLFNLTCLSQAQELKTHMLEMGEIFKQVSRSVATSEVGPQTQEQMERLLEVVLLAKEELPRGLDPADQAGVLLFNTMMDELVSVLTELDVVIKSLPFDRKKALALVSSLSEIRKKGHATFR